MNIADLDVEYLKFDSTGFLPIFTSIQLEYSPPGDTHKPMYAAHIKPFEVRIVVIFHIIFVFLKKKNETRILVAIVDFSFIILFFDCLFVIVKSTIG